MVRSCDKMRRVSDSYELNEMDFEKSKRRSHSCRDDMEEDLQRQDRQCVMQVIKPSIHYILIVGAQTQDIALLHSKWPT